MNVEYVDYKSMHASCNESSKSKYDLELSLLIINNKPDTLLYVTKECYQSFQSITSIFAQ
jgi:hypothetical protein